MAGKSTQSTAILQAGNSLSLSYDLKNGLYGIFAGKRAGIECAAWEIVANMTLQSPKAGPGKAKINRIDKTPLGPCQELVVTHKHPDASGRELIFRARAYEKHAGIALCVEFPLDPSDAPLMEINPLVVSQQWGGKLTLPGCDIEDARILANGYHSWEHSTFLPFYDGANRGSHFFTCLADGESKRGIALGQLTANAAETTFQRYDAASPSSNGNYETPSLDNFCARSSLRLLSPTRPAIRSSEWIWIGFEENAEIALENWADAFRKINRVRFNSDVHAGYCTWYIFQREISAEIIRRNIASQSETLKRYGYGLFQVDDGATSWHGDWTVTNKRLKGITLKGIPREAHKKGLLAGLWLTPFLISERSRVWRENPEWFARDDEGSPQTASFKWGDEKCYIPDGTNSAARNWMSEQFRRLSFDFCFDYFKLDFCFSGTEGRHFHDPNMTFVEAYRAMMKAIRKGAGRDAFLLGCGAPLAASAGCFDGMRIGPDTGWTVDESQEGRPLVATWHQMSWALCNVASRTTLHGKLWHNDPDCVLARGRRNLLTMAERRTLASTMALSGGMILASDDLPELEPEELDLLRRIAPVHSPRSTCIDQFTHEGGFPSVWVQPAASGRDKWIVVALVNTTDETKAVKLPFNKIDGLNPGQFNHLWEFWSSEYYGAVCDDASFYIPPHDCLVFSVREAKEHPWIISIDRHISQGGVEMPGALKIDERRLCISGNVRPRGSEKITLWFYFPQGTLPAWYECPEAEGRLVEKGENIWGLELKFKDSKLSNLDAEWAFTIGWGPAESKFVNLNDMLPKRIHIKNKTQTSATLEWENSESLSAPTAWRVVVCESERFSKSKIIHDGITVNSHIKVDGLRGGTKYMARIRTVGEWSEESSRSIDVKWKSPNPKKSIYLSSLPGITIQTPGGIFNRDRDILLGPLTIGKRQFKRGIITLAADEIRISLPSNYSRLTGWFAIPRKEQGELTFPPLQLEISIEGQKKPIYKSETATPCGKPVPIEVRLKGAPRALIFRVVRTDGLEHLTHWSLLNAKLS